MFLSDNPNGMRTDSSKAVKGLSKNSRPLIEDWTRAFETEMKFWEPFPEGLPTLQHDTLF